MKKISLIVALLIMGLCGATAQRYSISGRVVDGANSPVAYATVVVVEGENQVAGGTTNSEGGFVVTLAMGEYTLNISYIGYAPYRQSISLRGSLDMGDIVIEESSEKIDEVVVTSQLIRREADRFVVDIANSPIALGKDGEELLKTAPGVWIQDDKISINGSSGSKIYLNDREVKMEDAQLIAYLRSLRAEDIQKIEVIPQSGADYDASSSGGIIKISTKRRIDSGLMGSVSHFAGYTRGYKTLSPSLSLNYNRGKLDAYARAWIGRNEQIYNTEEHTDYTSGTVIDAKSELYNNTYWRGGNLGVVYDFNDRHSVGGELQYNNHGGGGTTETWTERLSNDLVQRTDGAYNNSYYSKMLTATLNYIYKLDDAGSTLKIIYDHTNSYYPNHNDYIDAVGDGLSIYRDDTESHYKLTTATLALEKILSPKLSFKAGVKYTNNSNANSAVYEDFIGTDEDKDNSYWQPNEDKNYDIGYTENIGAVYATLSARFGRLSVVGGLRGEYTSFSDNSGEVNQNYFDLFPNANLSYSLTEDGAYSLVAQYSRTISRPSFWALSPNETKISEYMIQRGNPNLKAAYDNSLSVTAVLKYKYTITVGMSLMQNAIQQATIADSQNPELLIIQYINYPTLNDFYASANLPIQITKWWATNINLTAMYLGQRIRPEEAIRRNLMTIGNAQMSFTLPHNHFIELGGVYMHGAVAGNTSMSDMANANVYLKKRLLENKLTLSVGVHNIIPFKQTITVKEADFERIMIPDQPWQRPTFRFQISYNFNQGKNFRAKSVESGSTEDRGRISTN